MGLSVTLSNALSRHAGRARARSTRCPTTSPMPAPPAITAVRSASSTRWASIRPMPARASLPAPSTSQPPGPLHPRHRRVRLPRASRLASSIAVQTLFGKPGTTGSIDSAYTAFEAALAAAATSPDTYANRAELISEGADARRYAQPADLRHPVAAPGDRGAALQQRRQHQQPAAVAREGQPPPRRPGHRPRLARYPDGSARPAGRRSVAADGSARQLSRRRHGGADDPLRRRHPRREGLGARATRAPARCRLPRASAPTMR